MISYQSFLTLDLAGRFGFAKWQPGSDAVIGTYLLPEVFGNDIGLYLYTYETWLKSNIERLGVDCLTYEKPILIHAGKNQTHFQTAYQLMNLAGTTEKICQEYNIACSNVSISEWRKHYLGYGGYSTDKAKRMAMEKCKAAGFKPQHHDAAEAFGILDYVAESFELKRDWPDVNMFGGRI